MTKIKMKVNNLSGYDDYHVGVVFCAANRLTTDGMKREKYILIGLKKYEVLIGQLIEEENNGSTPRRNLLC